MKTKIFSLIAALLLFLPLSKAQSGGYNYEGNKQSLVLRAMNNYFSFFQQTEATLDIMKDMSDASIRDEIDLDEINEAGHHIQTNFQWLNPDDVYTAPFRPGSIYSCKVSTDDETKMGILVLIVGGTVESPVLFVKKHIQIVAR